MNIKLKKFSLDKLKINSGFVYNNILIIGEDSNDKIKFVKKILEYHNDIKNGLIITNTPENYENIKTESPQRLEELTHEFMKGQKELRKRINNGEKDLDYRRLIVMNDSLKDKKWLKDTSIREMYMNGRTWGVFYIMTSDMRIVKKIPANLRANIDYIFIFNIDKDEREKLYEDYANMIPTYELFNIIMDECTKNHECLVIENCSPSQKLEDQIYWFKIE